MFQKYTQKPVLVGAINWDGSEEVAKFLVDLPGGLFNHYSNTNMLYMASAYGPTLVHHGWWVIDGAEHHGFIICEPNEFKSTYMQAALEEEPKKVKKPKVS